MTDERTLETEQAGDTRASDSHAEEYTSETDKLIAAAFEAAEAEEAQEAEPQEEEQAPDRDGKGRFAKKEDEPEEGSRGEAEEDSTEPQAEDEDQEASLEAPSSFTAEQRERFSKLPREAQEDIKDVYRSVQADYTRKTQDLAEERKFAEQNREWLGQIDSYVRSTQPGISTAEAAMRLFNYESALRTGTPDQKRQMLMQLATDYQIPLSESAGYAQQGQGYNQPDPFADPQVTALTQQVQGLQGQLQQMHMQPVIQRQQQQLSTWEGFKNELNDEGQLAHPHVERVQHAVAAFLKLPEIQQKLDTDPKAAFEDAYERAVWADPELRSTLTQGQAEQVREDTEAERKARVAKAKKAGTPIKGKTRPTAKKVIKTADDAVSAALDMHEDFFA